MVGASDGRNLQGANRGFGVSVFDFKVSHLAPKIGWSLTRLLSAYGRHPGFEKTNSLVVSRANPVAVLIFIRKVRRRRRGGGGQG